MSEIKPLIIGTGSFGSAMAIVLGKSLPNTQIIIWGRRLEIVEDINNNRRNSEYLPPNSLKFPDNIIATNNLQESVKISNIIFIAIPSIFLEKILYSIDLNLNNKILISLVKGIFIKDNQVKNLFTVCELLNNRFPKCDCCVLSGPNIYSDLARGKFAEATIGSYNLDIGNRVKNLFTKHSNFKTNVTFDRFGVEYAGLLKNIISLGCGFIDYIGSVNARAALIRQGIHEMYNFTCTLSLNDNLPSKKTFFEDACGIGDLILTTHYGRGFILAKEFLKESNIQKEKDCAQIWQEVESNLFNNMKIPDIHNCFIIGKNIENRGLTSVFPILNAIYSITWKKDDPNILLHILLESP